MQLWVARYGLKLICFKQFGPSKEIRTKKEKKQRNKTPMFFKTTNIKEAFLQMTSHCNIIALCIIALCLPALSTIQSKCPAILPANRSRGLTPQLV